MLLLAARYLLQVNAGDILADIETDKATLGFDSQEDGYASH
jgi:pyruvate/2-oxoglutarate dehydrogenase complex dihydrolipoamide acyltransferase (E2) component